MMSWYEWLSPLIAVMTWQDWVFFAAECSFIYALVATIKHPTEKPAFSTSLQTAVAMIAVTIVTITLDLWLTAIAMSVNTVQWFLLAWQRRLLDLKQKGSR